MLKQLALDTGGKYYEVRNNNALPRIFQREARRVARPLVYEQAEGFAPQVHYPHEMLSGIEAPLPPITGYVMTTLKNNPLVEVALLSPMPTDGENNVVLASWTYGLGRTVAFTSDAGTRWATSWNDWDDYDKFFSQMVRWAMRPVGRPGKFSVATDMSDGRVRVVVTALDKDDEFLNLLEPDGHGHRAGHEARELKMQQVAPGRYQGEFDAKDSGSYFVAINPGAGQAPILTGVNVPYSAEFRERATNEPLLTTLAGMKPQGGEPGELIEDPTQQDRLEELLKVNSFRQDLPKATSSQEAWHLLVLVASVLFFYDVFVRRVTINLDWAKPYAVRVRDKLLGREPRPAQPEYLLAAAQPQGGSDRADRAEACRRPVRAAAGRVGRHEHAGRRAPGRRTGAREAARHRSLLHDATAEGGGELHRPAAEGEEKSVGRPGEREGMTSRNRSDPDDSLRMSHLADHTMRSSGRRVRPALYAPCGSRSAG